MPSPKKSRLEELHAEIAESLLIAEEAEDLRTQAVVLRAEITAEQNRYSAIATKTKQAQAAYELASSSNAESLQRQQLEIDAQRQSLHDLEQQCTAASQLLSEAKDALTGVNVAISDAQIRRQRIDRENQQVLQDHQTNIKTMENTITETQVKINSLVAELQRQAYTKELNDQQLKTNQTNLESQTAVYKQKAEQYRMDLAAMDVEVANKRSLVLSFDADMNKRKAEIEAQQESIDTQSMAMTGRAADLDARAKKLRLDYRMAGQAYDAV